MRVRELAWTDIPALAVLDPQLFPHEGWSEATWWAELAQRPRRDYLVAEEAGQPLGYAGIDHRGQVSDIMTLAVVPGVRGRGLGADLLARLLSRAGERGAQSVLLEVRADNAAALRLYERAGFQRLSVRRRYYQPGDVDAHVLAWRVR